MIYNIVSCGVGGQGLMFLSNAIGLACAEFGFKIRTAETHGLAQRSGSIYTHIRISQENEIHSPMIPYGDAKVLLSLEAIEALRNIEFLKKDGIIILNKYIWHPVQSTFDRVKNSEKRYITIDDIIAKLQLITKNITLIDALALANEVGNPLASNLVLLGVLARQENFPLALDQLTTIIPSLVPKNLVEVNIKALQIGYKRFS